MKATSGRAISYWLIAFSLRKPVIKLNAPSGKAIGYQPAKTRLSANSFFFQKKTKNLSLSYEYKQTNRYLYPKCATVCSAYPESSLSAYSCRLFGCGGKNEMEFSAFRLERRNDVQYE